MARAVRALNALAVGRGDGVVHLVAPSYAVPGDPLSAAQSSALDNIGRAVKACLPAPSCSELYPDGALCELLRSRDIYDVQQSLTVTPYDAEKLKVLRGGTRPRGAKALVGERAREYLEHATALIERPAADIDADERPPVPHWDARLRYSRKARDQFIDQLCAVGLIAWRRRAKQQAGVFFVCKKTQEIRMVVDCRPANHCHRAPPHSALSTAAALAAINLAPSWLGEDAGAGVAVDPHGAAIDLADGYYQFAVPEMASWFSLGVRRTAREAGASTVYCDEARCEVEGDPDERLWACFGGLPMG